MFEFRTAIEQHKRGLPMQIFIFVLEGDTEDADQRRFLEEARNSGITVKPFHYPAKGGEPFLFAGLWETWHGDGEPLETCAILTTEANKLAAEVHDRMPVMLEGDEALW